MRPYWKAIYNDGTEVLEFMPGGIVSNFYDVEKDRLARFELVCSNDLVIGFDAATGIFYLNNKDIYHPQIAIAYNLPIKYAQGLIQFKKAYVPIDSTYDLETGLPTFGDEVIQSFNIGYKITHDHVLAQVIASFKPMNHVVAFEMKLTDIETQETLTDRIEVR